MNNIYVDELPKSCDECEHKQVTHKTKDGMYTSYACPFKDGKLAFGESAPMRNCPLKPLTHRLAEERKKVVSEIWQEFESYFESSNLKWEDKMLVGKVCNMINEILDQVRGEG